MELEERENCIQDYIARSRHIVPTATGTPASIIGSSLLEVTRRDVHTCTLMVTENGENASNSQPRGKRKHV